MPFDEDDEVYYDTDEEVVDPPPENTVASTTFFGKVRDKLMEFSSKYPNILTDIRSILETIIDFRKNKEPLKILDGAVILVDSFKGNNFSGVWSFLSAKNGFIQLMYKKVNMAFLFKDVIEKFPSRTIRFSDGTFIILYALPIGDVYTYNYGSEYNIYYNNKKINKKDLTDFLVKQKYSILDTKFLSYYKDDTSNVYTLKSCSPNIKLSKRGEDILNYVKGFIDMGMNRSILFYGAPGTGKSSLTNSVVSSLNYKTLIFSASYRINTITILDYIIDLFGIEAIIIDDFDQFNDSNTQLDLLEMLNRKLKLVVGVANSLQ